MGLFNSLKEELLKGMKNFSADLGQTEGLGNTYFEFIESSPDLYNNSTRGDIEGLLIKDSETDVNAPPKLFKDIIDDSDNYIESSDVSIVSSDSTSETYIKLNENKNFRLSYSSSLDFNGQSATGIVLINDSSGDAASISSGTSITPASNDELIAHLSFSSSLDADGSTEVKIPITSTFILFE